MGKPKIRFKGYNDEWEQRKLGDWGNFYYGRSCPKWSVTEDATIPCIRYGELYTKFGAKIDRVYSYTNMPPENLRFSRGTEVLIPRVGEDPMDYNHCTWLSMQDVAIGEMISVFNTDNNPLFTATMFNATLQNEFAMRVEGGSVTNLYFEKLKNIEVSFPSIPEQKKIAAYFENLDRLITLHQRKCDEMKTLKKYMLQKMFPQNGQKISEIRFEGFTDEWEQRKCKDIFDRVAKAVDVEVGEVYREIGIRSHGKGLFYKDEIAGEGLGNKRVFWVEPNSFILNIVFAWERAVAKTTEKELGMIASHRFPMYKPKENVADLDYITKFFITHKGKYILEMASPGGAGRNKTLGQKEFENSTICLPSYEEQKKIGRYLEVFDHLITLHQRKCDELKSIKKFMLQNMFI